ncbi:MAG: hypothetical protein V7L13_15025 [Nostoc sp.]
MAVATVLSAMGGLKGNHPSDSGSETNVATVLSAMGGLKVLVGALQQLPTRCNRPLSNGRVESDCDKPPDPDDVATVLSTMGGLKGP